MSTAKVDRVVRPTRQYKRYPHLRELSIAYEGSSENIAIRPPDVSVQGMFINTSRRFPEGAILTVRFTLARSNRQIQARSEVRYCLPGVGIGVEFLDISPEDQAAIEAENHYDD